MDFLGKIEAYLPEGKVEYDIEDGEIFTEEDYDSLVEQGEFDDDGGDDVILTDDMIREITNRYRNGQYDDLVDKITNNLIVKNKTRIVKKKKNKMASQSRKINRSK